MCRISGLWSELREQHLVGLLSLLLTWPAVARAAEPSDSGYHMLSFEAKGQLPPEPPVPGWRGAHPVSTSAGTIFILVFPTCSKARGLQRAQPGGSAACFPASPPWEVRICFQLFVLEAIGWIKHTGC